MNFSLKKKVAVAAAAATLVGGVGVAFAYWTSTGSGTGSASTTAGASNLSYTQAALNAMYPGDSAQPLVVTVKNENSTGSQYVLNVKAYVTTDKAGCSGGDFKINGSAAPSVEASAVALAWTATDLAAGASAATSGDTIQFNNLTATNQDACKNAAVTVHYVTTA